MIVVPSLNTAREAIVLAPGWSPGAVARAEATLLRPAGKPLNVARFAALMGGESHLVALADAGLATEVEAACADAGAGCDVVLTAAASRTDVTILDGEGGATVFNGPGIAPSPAELEALLALLRQRLRRGGLLVLAGSLPRGISPSLLGKLAVLGERRGAGSVVDATGTLLDAALRLAPAVAKVNAAELAEARGDGDAERSFAEGRRLAPEPANLVVTGGVRGLRAWLADGSHFEVRPPALRAVNPVGAGDAVTAAIAVALDAGRPLLDGLVAGSAWAAARTLQLDLEIDPDEAERLTAGVTVERLG